MGQITGGSIKYGRTVKTGDFENKRADAEIAFTVGDGEAHDEIIKSACKIAHTHVHTILGLKLNGVAAVEQPAAEPAASPAPATPAAPKVVTKADLEKEAKKPKKPPAAPAEDAAAVTEVKAAPADNTGRSATAANERPDDPAAVTDDGLGDLLGNEPAPITDAELLNFITKHNVKIKNPTAIRKLVSEFAGPPPKQARDIPVAKRPEFVEKLHAL